MALAGGVIFALLSLLTVTSITGRSLFLLPVMGDYELVEVGSGIGIFLALPYTQLQREHIVVDLIAGVTSRGKLLALDALAAIVFGVVMTILSWRLFFGAMDFISSRETSMLLSIPRWWSYLIIIPSCVMTALACAVTSIREIRKVAK